MRSIRRSLVLYFLGLLGLGLGAVGLLVDRFARDAAHAREEAEAGRIALDYEHRRRETLDQIDVELLAQAKALGRVLDGQFLQLARRDDDFRLESRRVLAVLPVGYLGSPWPVVTSSAIAHSIPARSAMFWTILSYTKYDDVRGAFEAYESPGPRTLFQFHFPRSRRVIHGPGPSADMPLDVDALNREPSFEARSETVDVPGVGGVRRVVYKAPLFPFRGFGGDPNWPPRPPSPPPTARPPEPRDGRDRRPPDSRRPEPQSFVYVQVGRELGGVEALCDKHRDQRDADMARLAADTQADTAKLRRRLGLIGLATCVALSVGGWLLVGWGLHPVRRLSDAVSRVSERDFRLPVERDELSRELLPIHAHLIDTLDDLRRAFEREKEAVADISHELRTPVAGMLATIDVALRKPRTADQYRVALEEVRGIGRQLAGLVERVMTLATLDAGGDQTAAVETDVAGVAERCAAVVRPLAVANGLKFEADLPLPVPVTTDPDKVREVVTNFLHNAVEYNRPGGTIRLSARPTPGGGAEVVVADTGIGMTPDVRDKIFERFYRADASRHAAGAHAGLGLSIVKEYVQRLGGAIAVESEAGVGSTFRLTLPAAVTGA